MPLGSFQECEYGKKTWNPKTEHLDMFRSEVALMNSAEWVAVQLEKKTKTLAMACMNGYLFLFGLWWFHRVFSNHYKLRTTFGFPSWGIQILHGRQANSRYKSSLP